MSEIVELLGGPRDGQRISIRHGNEVAFAYVESLPLLTIKDSDAPYSMPPIERIIYRRSPRNPSRFLFLPMRKDGMAERA